MTIIFLVQKVGFKKKSGLNFLMFVLGVFHNILLNIKEEEKFSKF